MRNAFTLLVRRLGYKIKQIAIDRKSKETGEEHGVKDELSILAVRLDIQNPYEKDWT
jgi:hypothetical protein